MPILSFKEKKNQLKSLENQKIKELLLLAEEAIRKSDRLDYISIKTKGFSRITIDVVVNELKSSGWDAKYHSCQREGGFIHVGPPNSKHLV